MRPNSAAGTPVIASDLEGRYVLERLGLSRHFKMLERPLGIRGVHAVASKEHVQAPELIDALNRGLKELKESDAYAAIVRRHLMRLWAARDGMMSNAADHPQRSIRAPIARANDEGIDRRVKRLGPAGLPPGRVRRVRLVPHARNCINGPHHDDVVEQ